LSHEPQVLIQALTQLSEVLLRLDALNHFVDDPGSSVLLQELANSPDGATTLCAVSVPLLHDLSVVHSCVTVFTQICKVGQVFIIKLVLCLRSLTPQFILIIYYKISVMSSILTPQFVVIIN